MPTPRIESIGLSPATLARIDAIVLSQVIAALARRHVDVALNALIHVAAAASSDAARAQATAVLGARGIARPLILRLAIATLVGRTTVEQHLLENHEDEALAGLPDVGEITSRLRPFAASLFVERGSPDTWDDRAEYAPAEYALLLQIYEECSAAIKAEKVDRTLTDSA